MQKSDQPFFNFRDLVEQIDSHEDAKKVAIILNATSHLVIKKFLITFIIFNISSSNLFRFRKL